MVCFLSVLYCMGAGDGIQRKAGESVDLRLFIFDKQVCCRIGGQHLLCELRSQCRTLQSDITALQDEHQHRATTPV